MYDDWNSYNRPPQPPQPTRPTQPPQLQYRPPQQQYRPPQQQYRPMQQQYQPMQPQYRPMPRLQPKRRKNTGLAVLIVVFCFIFAIAAGFAGGYIANMRKVASERPEIYQITPQPPEGIFDLIPEPASENAATVSENAASANNPFAPSVLVNSASGQVLTTPEVAAIARQTVVEIKTEIVTSGMRMGTYVSEGAGSGVIVSEDGYIITNDHVISGATSISVRLSDGREFPASLIGTDSKTDIAVIKISATGLSPAKFGDSSLLVIGESALAVGNPLGELGGTVTGGIISALDREITVEGETMSLLQTDAAVNPGNSGGGLFNMRAELIGIVNSKSSGLNIEGLGFAIPSNIARTVANDIIAFGYVRGRVDAGLDLLDITTAQSARWYRVSQTGLYVINSADPQLKNGDRITAINGMEIVDLYDYNEAMKSFSVGDEITITVSRGNETISASIALSEWRP